jgi:hypothetical protein
MAAKAATQATKFLKLNGKDERHPQWMPRIRNRHAWVAAFAAMTALGDAAPSVSVRVSPIPVPGERRRAAFGFMA